MTPTIRRAETLGGLQEQGGLLLRLAGQPRALPGDGGAAGAGSGGREAG